MNWSGTEVAVEFIRFRLKKVNQGPRSYCGGDTELGSGFLRTLQPRRL